MDPNAMLVKTVRAAEHLVIDEPKLCEDLTMATAEECETEAKAKYMKFSTSEDFKPKENDPSNQEAKKRGDSTVIITRDDKVDTVLALTDLYDQAIIQKDISAVAKTETGKDSATVLISKGMMEGNSCRCSFQTQVVPTKAEQVAKEIGKGSGYGASGGRRLNGRRLGGSTSASSGPTQEEEIVQNPANSGSDSGGGGGGGDGAGSETTSAPREALPDSDSANPGAALSATLATLVGATCLTLAKN